MTLKVFKKGFLEQLKGRIDLVDVLQGYVSLKRSGAAFKGLCPFHEEKTPSFLVQAGDAHYHCFGCGAHGDAIAFLMHHQHLSFAQAVELLAERFGIPIEREEKNQEEAQLKTALKKALESATQFYQFFLLHTEEGRSALQFLYQRGIDLDFIQRFRLGLAPAKAGIFQKAMQEEQISLTLLKEAGLMLENGRGGERDFFFGRILFPIQDYLGNVIGFSGRRYRDCEGGGKYINTPETPLFKKSKVLFGISHARKQIAKEQQALIVEGQIDALRLIQEEFTSTVAGQGTAFGKEQVQELLRLGVKRVFLAFDGDVAGKEAMVKVGDLFQREGVETRIVKLPSGQDPDLFLRERGREAFASLMAEAEEYLGFLVRQMTQDKGFTSPAAKNQLLQVLAKQIREWKEPVVVHESLKRLAHLAAVPEQLLGVGVEFFPEVYFKKQESLFQESVDPDKILETDLLRWLLLSGKEMPELLHWAQKLLLPADFRVPVCKFLWEQCLFHPPTDLLSFSIAVGEHLQDPLLLAEIETLLGTLSLKKIQPKKALPCIAEIVQKMLYRNWMEKREQIRIRLQSGYCSDAEVTALLKEFDLLKASPPKIFLPEFS